MKSSIFLFSVCLLWPFFQTLPSEQTYRIVSEGTISREYLGDAISLMEIFEKDGDQWKHTVKVNQENLSQKMLKILPVVSGSCGYDGKSAYVIRQPNPQYSKSHEIIHIKNAIESFGARSTRENSRKNSDNDVDTGSRSSDNSARVFTKELLDRLEYLSENYNRRTPQDSLIIFKERKFPPLYYTLFLNANYPTYISDQERQGRLKHDLVNEVFRISRGNKDDMARLDLFMNSFKKTQIISYHEALCIYALPPLRDYSLNPSFFYAFFKSNPHRQLYVGAGYEFLSEPENRRVSKELLLHTYDIRMGTREATTSKIEHFKTENFGIVHTIEIPAMY